MKDLITCFKLIPYGKKAKFNIVLGIVFIALGLLTYTGFVLSDFEMTYFPAFLIFEGSVFLTQPAMSIAQRGGLAFSPIRKTVEIYYQPLCIFLSATAANILWTLIGCIALTVNPEAAKTTAFTMFMGVIFCIMFAGAMCTLKINLAAYIVSIAILSAVLIGGQVAASELMENIFDSKGPVIIILLSALVSEVCCFIVSLLCLLFCKCFYKKNYSKFVKRMIEFE